MSRTVLDLTNHHFRRELGDITLFGTWIGETVDDSEPAIVLVPTHRPASKVNPACVALSSAYKYDDPAYLLKAARIFNQGMGFDDTMAHVHKVADIIHSHLLDLIKMPMRPVRATSIGANATLTDRETGKSETVEIKDLH